MVKIMIQYGIPQDSPPVPDPSLTKISAYGWNMKMICCSGFIAMEFKISFEERMEHTRNKIIAHTKHKTTYQVFVDINQLK